MASDTKPLVSILMIAYNAERYIKEAIDSALGQTYPNIEIIIVDDGSKDRTADIAKSYEDSRIRYFYQENQGIVRARNRTLREAKGVFLTCLDSDDIYLPRKVAEEVKFLEENSEYSGVYCDLRYFFDGNPRKLYRHRYQFYSGDAVFPELLKKMFITNTTVMFRREIYDKLGGYDENLVTVEDWDFFLRMVYAGYRFGFLDKDLVRFRTRWDSNTNFGRQVDLKSDCVKTFMALKRRMTEADRKKWNIDYYIARRKETLVFVLMSDGRKKDALRLYHEIRSYIGFAKAVVIFSMAITPTFLLRVAVEKAWNSKKRGLFIPIH